MRALVIGGNGFIGTNLVSRLREEGADVRVFDRYPSRMVKPRTDVEYVIGDLENHGQLHEVVQGVDWVFHLACTTIPKTSNEDPVFDVHSNLVTTIQLLQECRAANVNKFVFVSSGGTVYGVPHSYPITETHSTDPICSYGITKLAVEKYLHLFLHLHGLEYVVLRMSNPYGPGQNPNAQQGAIGVFLGHVAQGETIQIWGDGEVIRDYIFIDDAVNALLAAAKYAPIRSQPRLFNIGSGVGVSLNQLVEHIRAIVDSPVRVNYTPSRDLDVPISVLAIEKAKKHLLWEPRTDLRAGLTKSWHWVRSLLPAGESIFVPELVGQVIQPMQ